MRPGEGGYTTNPNYDRDSGSSQADTDMTDHAHKDTISSSDLFLISQAFRYASLILVCIMFIIVSIIEANVPIIASCLTSQLLCQILHDQVQEDWVLVGGISQNLAMSRQNSFFSNEITFHRIQFSHQLISVNYVVDSF